MATCGSTANMCELTRPHAADWQVTQRAPAETAGREDLPGGQKVESNCNHLCCSRAKEQKMLHIHIKSCFHIHVVDGAPVQHMQ